MNIKFCNINDTPLMSCHSHSHKYWEIVYQLSGSVTSFSNGNEYNMSVGDIMIIPPGIIHKSESSSPYTDMYIQCENMDFSKITIVHDYDGFVLDLINMLHRVFTEKDNSYKSIADSLLDTITAYLCKYADNEYKYDFVNELKNEMYINLSNCDFNISNFAKRHGYNMDYLRKCFKSETGKTPLEHLTDMRLNYAKGLLKQETFVSVADVAEKCGFKDSFYFSRLFKQHYGVSPLNYRKKVQYV